MRVSATTATGVAALVALLTTAGCTPRKGQAPAATSPPSATPIAASEEAGSGVETIGAAHAALVRALAAGDAEAFVSLLADSPDTLLYLPTARDRIAGRDAARRAMPYLHDELGNLEWTESHAVVTRDGDVAWVTAQFAMVSPKRATPFLGRETEVWIMQDGAWRLIHGHWSQTPEHDLVPWEPSAARGS